MFVIEKRYDDNDDDNEDGSIQIRTDTLQSSLVGFLFSSLHCRFSPPFFISILQQWSFLCWMLLS